MASIAQIGRSGPVAHAASPWIARALATATLLVVGIWVHSYLGGVAAAPDVLPDGGNSTDRLFNWHPVLMTLAFVVLMSESLMAYKAPLSQKLDRPWRKTSHWVLHATALLCAALGLTAVWRSHDLKLPPIPNLYSPHSWLGLTAALLLGLQFVAGLGTYLWPTLPLEQRAAFLPLHKFLGLATYTLGLAAAAAGLQEKSTFLQAFGKKGVHSAFIQLPAAAVLLLAGTGLAVGYTLTQAGAAGPRKLHVSTDEEDVPLAGGREG